jgi:hypothetical protein
MIRSPDPARARRVRGVAVCGRLPFRVRIAA